MVEEDDELHSLSNIHTRNLFFKYIMMVIIILCTYEMPLTKSSVPICRGASQIAFRQYKLHSGAN